MDDKPVVQPPLPPRPRSAGCVGAEDAAELPPERDRHGGLQLVACETGGTPVTPGNLATIKASFPLPRQMNRFYGFETQLFQVSVPESLGV